ncbi:cytochrome b/b6 domain-containing protein [Psychromonas ossibalaenae]|uniref:cytochrome b/b6 domain-containing protein n=1 Tax=Psychromonas ossibalaenae TaxID=444922 RepID=UPI00036BB16B|nr:cytochrome b/b6 domain-containing protein [Psychromonas ossibalaenae]
MKKTTTLYKRFERFWHWGQALLVVALIFTGLELHGITSIIGFETSSHLHHIGGFVWTGLVVLIFTWILTTGEWKQFIPDMDGIDGVLRYYLYGVFIGEAHPHHMTAENKFNPLQRMTYLLVLFGLVPLQIITGLVFFFFPEIRAAGVIEHIGFVAAVHTFCAYAVIAFLIVHLYMITFGAKLSSHLKSMLTGKETLGK